MRTEEEAESRGRGREPRRQNDDLHHERLANWWAEAGDGMLLLELVVSHVAHARVLGASLHPDGVEGDAETVDVSKGGARLGRVQARCDGERRPRGSMAKGVRGEETGREGARRGRTTLP